MKESAAQATPPAEARPAAPPAIRRTNCARVHRGCTSWSCRAAPPAKPTCAPSADLLQFAPCTGSGGSSRAAAPATSFLVWFGATSLHVLAHALELARALRRRVAGAALRVALVA
jgi:hypothetical protein